MGVNSQANAFWNKLPSSRHGAVLFLAPLLLAVLSRRFLFDAADPYRCRALAHDGQWFRDYTWLVPGCSAVSYGGNELRECAEDRKIVLIGDWETQWLYWALVEKLDHESRPTPVPESLRSSKGRVDLQFVWDPYLNSTGLHDSTQAYHEGAKGHRPLLTIIGAGQWHIENGALVEYTNALGKIASTAGLVDGALGSHGLSLEDGPGDLLLFAPVQEPYSEHPDTDPELGPYRDLNTHLERVLGDNVLWSFGEMTAARKDKYLGTLHAQDEVSRKRADVLLNLRCNAKLARRGGFPNVRTCCGAWAGPNWIQSGFLVAGLGILPALVLVDYRSSVLTPSARTLIRALCAFMAAVSLQYITDRTHVFEQVTRLQLELSNLRNMIAFVILIGLATIRRSSSPKQTSPGENRPDNPFLPRDQTDEWKGWMQALIIVYHYNMAWSADWFWEIIRLAVTSYLFLTGFGHTIFFLQKRDYSFRRFAAVMIRTNLLPVALAYVMRTRWLLYYYMPLSTFWFVVVYATLAIGRSYNDRTYFLIAKIVTSAALVEAFLSTPDLAETVVRVFALTCKISFNAQDFFHHRVEMDKYIVYVGMLAAILYIWAKDVLSSNKRQDVLSLRFRRLFPVLNAAIVAIAGLSFVGFWVFVHTHIGSQHEFEAWQPYISFIPVLSFAVLRNAHPYLRNFHSAAFAWLGRYSGEMYVMQDHIWLAGDQEAVLRTGFFHGDESVSRDRWRDLLLITPLYLIACSIIGDATTAIATSFVKEDSPAENRSAYQNATQLAEVEMGLLSGENGGETSEKIIVRPSLQEWIQRLLWPKTVRNRVLLLLGLLWGLNMTYT